jgi:secreted trypsin-like serine protease
MGPQRGYIWGIVVRGFNKIAVLFCLTLTLPLAACSPAKQTSLYSPETDTHEKNIIGGSNVAEGSDLSRSVVLLANALTHEICSAALIGGNFATTAAHCIDVDNVENMYVFFAVKPGAKTERRQVKKAKVSPYWEFSQNEEKNTSDIAVIKFDGNGLPSGYEPVQFLEDDAVLTKGTTAIILGYGVTDATTQTGAGVLRFTTLQISDPKFSPTELLLDQSKGTGACHGDSGGPAFVNLKDKKGQNHYYMWGVANHSSNDDIDNLCNKSVIYTNATVFITWMELVKQSL